jgi:hypothetical protein
LLNDERSELIGDVGRVDVEGGCDAACLSTDVSEGVSSIQVEGVSRRIFRFKPGQLKVHICGREPITVPIGFTFARSFSWHFVSSVGGGISDEDDLVDHFLPIDGLEEHLHCLISCSSFGSHSLQEPFEVGSSVLIGSRLDDLLLRTIVVSEDHNFDLNGSLHTVLFQHFIGPFKRNAAYFTCLFQARTHGARSIDSEDGFDVHLCD